MARYRSYSVEFKRQVAQEFLGGETLHALAGAALRRQIPEVGAVCGNAARAILCGGRA